MIVVLTGWFQRWVAWRQRRPHPSDFEEYWRFTYAYELWRDERPKIW